MKELIKRLAHKEATVKDYLTLGVVVVLAYTAIRVVLSVTGIVLGLALDILVHIAPIAVVAFVVYKVLKDEDRTNV